MSENKSGDASIGTASVSEGVLSFRSPLRQDFDVQLEDVLVVGEVFTAGVSYGLDYYLLVWDSELMHQVPVGCVGFESAWRSLESSLGCDLDLNLRYRESFDSRVFWPSSIAGAEAVRFEKEGRYTVFERILSKLLGTEYGRLIATDAVQGYIDKRVDSEGA